MFNLLLTIFLLLFTTNIIAHTTKKIIMTDDTILADITKNISGNKLTVIPLIKANTDPHSYQLVPSDIVKLNKSSLFITTTLFTTELKSFKNNYSGHILQINSSHDIYSLHNWMDPQIVYSHYLPSILHTLVKLFPQYSSYFTHNEQLYKKKLIKVDNIIKK